MSVKGQISSLSRSTQANLPADADEFLKRLEQAGQQGVSLDQVEPMGLTDSIKAAREAVRTASMILCTNDEKYEDARKNFEDNIEPAIQTVAEVILAFTISQKEAAAIAVAAFKVVYRVGKASFCALTGGLRGTDSSQL